MHHFQSVSHLNFWATGRTTPSRDCRQQLLRHLLAITVLQVSTTGSCRRASWGARPYSLVGVSKRVVQNCAVPTVELHEREGVKRLKLIFTELGEKVIGEMWLCGVSDLLQS